jgi:predicted GNAT superfamily acetyltransferase
MIATQRPMSVRDAIRTDFEAIVRLNEASVAETSPLDLAALTRLASISAYFKASVNEDRVAGFLLGLREDAPYENENFRWFAARFSRFLYIDRVVVDGQRRGTGVGSALYADIERHARETGVNVLTCEVNVLPENRASLAFHDRRGFVEIGRQALRSGDKTVAMLVRRLEPV